MTEPTLTHRPEGDRPRGTFELSVDGKRAGYLSYSLAGDATMIVEYVEVNPSLRGRGLGERLVAAAVDWARAHRRQIVPLCSYARAVFARTPAYKDVLTM